MFLPSTPQEIKALGWDRPDIILVTGDAYIDSPYIGVAVIGKYLMKHGFRVAVIAQPSTLDNRDIGRLGEPALFWGVTAGCIDSMVANYTPTRKWRNQDDYTPGGVNIRPDRATIAYTNLIRRFFKPTKPIVLGGIEASLRRVAHFDYWSNALRRSVLFDAKADIIAYGMAEQTTLALAEALRNGTDWKTIPGICYAAHEPAEGYITLPSFEEVKSDKEVFRKMFLQFYEKIDVPGTGFNQKHADRWLVHTPAPAPLSTDELDAVCGLEFEYDAHPACKTGEIRALETIKQSITTHRGCFGQCNFCAIAVHQGRTVVSRSMRSILDEAKRLMRLPGNNGIIYDVGGPTANMYGASCPKKGTPCTNRHCLMPEPCPNLSFGHHLQMELLDRLRGVPGVKKVFIASGIRHDMVAHDREFGGRYVEQLVKHHVSGQIKLAPEHSENEVLALMNKPSVKTLLRFKEMFDNACQKAGKDYFLTYYLMATHPGCSLYHMESLRSFTKSWLRIMPEQVQVFTPTPSTVSTMMYHCETDAAGRKVFVEKDRNGAQRQKDALKKPEQRQHSGRPRPARPFPHSARKPHFRRHRGKHR